jgi:hypothetical protein
MSNCSLESRKLNRELNKRNIAELLVRSFGDKNNITNHREFPTLLSNLVKSGYFNWLSLSNEVKDSCSNGIEYCSPLLDQFEIDNLISA